jgi:uncharacterized protein (DUF488 family)
MSLQAPGSDERDLNCGSRPMGDTLNCPANSNKDSERCCRPARNSFSEVDRLFTIGHSSHAIDRFIGLLRLHAITAVGDVRSSPYSKVNPQFNREALQKSLKASGIAYVFLGQELGPRSEDPSCYVDGKVRYDRLAATVLFKRGIERLFTGMKTYRIALMCAEKDPITCHRTILVCRAIRSEPIEISHILEDGTLETLPESELRLLHTLEMPPAQVFDKAEDLIQRAYDTQGMKIAYVRAAPPGEECC